MKCIQCSHRGVCKYVEEDFRKLEKAEQWASQKIEIMEEKEACERFERDTEDVAPVVHARWEELTDGGYLDHRMICSNCSNISTPLVSWKFCPNCGAKMDIE